MVGIISFVVFKLELVDRSASLNHICRNKNKTTFTIYVKVVFDVSQPQIFLFFL